MSKGPTRQQVEEASFNRGYAAAERRIVGYLRRLAAEEETRPTRQKKTPALRAVVANRLILAAAGVQEGEHLEHLGEPH